MVLQRIFILSFVLALLGTALAFFVSGYRDALWFGVGAAASLINFAVAVLFIRNGFEKVRNKGLMVGIVLFKSLSFIGLLAVLLIFLKPALLAFTLGVGIVIVGALLWAIWESRKLVLKGSFE